MTKLQKRNLIVCGNAAMCVLETCADWDSLPYDHIIFVNHRDVRHKEVSYTWVPFQAPAEHYGYIEAIGVYTSRKQIYPVPLPLGLQSAILKGDGLWTVFACLGGAGGCTLYLSLALYLAGKDLGARFIGSVPFRFEGKKKISRVQDIIDKVADIHSQEVVQLDRVREHGRLLSVAKYFQHADQELLQVLRG